VKARPAVATLCAVSFTLLFASCAQNQTAHDSNANATVFSTTPPFETKEPQSYRATRTLTTVDANGKTTITKSSIARDGEMRRDESEENGQRLIDLTLPEGRFLLLPDQKAFSPTPSGGADNSGDEPSESSPDRLLHTETVTSGYQKLGNETVNGRNLQKYRVVVNNSSGENVSVGETLLWFDEALHMPVKTQISSPDGTRVTAEISDVVLDVDKHLFEIPKDYRKLDFIELGERLKRNQP
jgi:outer membrane lipoprotein-sorting protein